MEFDKSGINRKNRFISNLEDAMKLQGLRILSMHIITLCLFVTDSEGEPIIRSQDPIDGLHWYLAKHFQQDFFQITAKTPWAGVLIHQFRK